MKTKTEISARVIEHSVFNVTDKPIATIVAVYPRWILAEVNTHRALSKSSMSSRAVPIRTILAQVWNDPAIPVEWGKHPVGGGMQAPEQLTGWRRSAARFGWIAASKVACGFAYAFWKLGLAKQLTNRVLEPWQWTTTVITATEWDNLWELRIHPDAQPEFRVLATAMKAALDASTPRTITPLMDGTAWGWHLPFVTDEERNNYPMYSCIQMSIARDARVSYLNHDGSRPDMGKDVKLFERLVGSRPLHASPTEHQAMPAGTAGEASANFRGWIQFRQLYNPTSNMHEVIRGYTRKQG